MQKVLRARGVALQYRSHADMHAWIKTLMGVGVLLWLMPTAAQAQAAQYKPDPAIFIEQERRDAERAAQQKAQQERSTEVRLPAAATASVGLLPTDESPCFKIHNVTLDSGLDSEPKDLLDAIGKTTSGVLDSPIGRCIGAQGIQIVIDRLQNELITRGYVTSRILAKPQNLQNGTLALELLLGKINRVQWAPPALGQMHRATEWNTLPMGQGDVLNLRDIEQALENYKRVPTAEADIQIAPGTEPGTSDLIISHQQAMPFRLSATADDSGTRSTGKYQGSLTFSYDNWWTLSDLFYVTMLHDLGGAEPGQRGTRGHIVHYSVPFGYWLMGFTNSNNRYHQTVAGANQDYLYSGTSRNMEAKLSRIMHRDAVGKTSMSLKGFQRTSNNYIDDAEVEVQRRVVGGLEWGLSHRRSWSGGSLDANVNYRRGTGAWGSRAAPEEAFGEGTSHMKLWLLDATVQQSFAAGEQRLQYTGNWRAQQNRTPLTPQDRFAIGGRFTVRGFDGMTVLSAERGWLLRNEISTPITAQIQAYLGVDTGHVSGPSAAQLVGQSLTGGVLGLRGQWARVQYEVFMGKPLSKPDHFKTSSSTAGFSISFSI